MSHESATSDPSQPSALIKHSFRKSLPSSMLDRSKNSIWSILKQCVDKELYRFTIPIVWNEPLSLLQRMAENMKYSNELLDKASDMPSAIDRMKYVAGFLVSCTSIHNDRLSKPFNPLLGETYEYLCTKNNYRICCEQVSHHPPISAYYSESILPTKSQPKWKYYGSVYPHMKLNILNASVEAFPEGIQTAELPEHGEVYTWHNLKINAHNLILGKLWFEYTGKTEIVNHKLKLKCVLEYKPYSWFYRQLNRCEGYILDSNDNKVALMYGKWNECLFSSNDVDNVAEFQKKIEKILNNEKPNAFSCLGNDKHYSNVQLLWKSNVSDKSYDQFYNFTEFTFGLNELYEELLSDTRFELKSNDGAVKSITIGPLPRTDSRFRPDMRLHEKGQIEIAGHEKNRLEEKQRETQRKMDSGELSAWKPLWFEQKKHNVCKEEDTWSFNDSYWNRDYSNCSNIY